MNEITAADILAEFDSSLVYFRRMIRRYDSRTIDHALMIQRYDALDAMRKHLRSDEFKHKVLMDRVKIKGGLK